ncbi:glycosyltransferase family 2 protein [Natronomonas salina]|uniref:glycosyltransferase family 2 protein n=1 Tax=Natronomonas salina TaxID=1710540 RepID=UPI0015B4ED9C|nr:glycosyltransferase family 2 protein [Natronomonas salina]QLD88709.1 glycosyltransferase family 2 protein [Natronomonas salina]
MYEGNTIGVVVPAYNEEGFVGEVIETMPSFVDRVYVVDDCSTDGTWEEIQEAKERTQEAAVTDGGAEGEFVVPIQHEENRGVGGAIKTGYLRARDDGIDVTAVMGGDGQMDPDDLDRILDPVVEGRADYSKSNRLIREEHHQEMPRFRYVGNHLLTLLTKIASGYWTVSDPQSGYTAISHEALEAVDIDEMYEFYGYCNDLIVRLSANDMRILDVPMRLTYGDEESSISYPEYIPRVSSMLLRMFVWRLAVKRDTAGEQLRSGLFLGGAVATVAGFVGAAAGRRPERLRIALLGVVGLLGGMATDAVTNREKNGRDE